MKFTVQAKTIAACNDFLKLIYQDNEYSLDEFSNTFKEKEFDLDQLLPQCIIKYRGEKMSYSEYVAKQRAISTRLQFFTRYRDEVLPQEIGLAIADQEYYQAAKFLEKAETCLQTARYYLFQSADILDYDCCINWKAGYQAIYDIRSMHFQTAIIWYNNCFDYIVQVAFLAFGLYKGIKRYNKDLAFEEILKMCTYNSLKVLHENQPSNTGLGLVWDIIENCRIARQDLNDWANYSKHKGGLGFVGLKPESPVQIYVGTSEGGYESRISEFEPITLDMDQSLEKVILAHDALMKCMSDLIDLINFPAAQYRINERGQFVIPDKNLYCKVRLNEES